MHQAAFARAYADSIGATLEIPEDWIGRRYFHGWDMFPPISRSCGRTEQDRIPIGIWDIDLHGYWQFQGAIDYLSRSQCKEWFRIRAENVNVLPSVNPVVIHKRRGDYLTTGKDVYVTISDEAYQAVVDMACNMTHVDAPLICHEDSGRSTLGDLFLMTQARCLVRANSTLSWWAGTLGHAIVIAPIIEGVPPGPQDNIRWALGNWPRLVNLPNVTDLHIPA